MIILVKHCIQCDVTSFCLTELTHQSHSICIYNIKMYTICKD